jgi:transposase
MVAGKRGPESYCTPELTQRMTLALKQGNYVKVAATMAGIGVSTHYQWMKLGEEGEQPYLAYAAAVHAAQVAAEDKALATILEAAQGWTETKVEVTEGDKGGHTVTTTTRRDWRAAAWFLAHRFAARWAREAEREDEQRIKRLEIDRDPALHLGPGRAVQGDSPDDGDGPAGADTN